jgi:protein-disulfide isomerase
MSKKVPKFRQKSQPGGSTPEARARSEDTPALVINIHTWATPIVAAVFLIIGLLGGYLLRPALSGGKSTGDVAVQPTVQAAEPTPSLDPVAAQATRDAVMSTLVSQAKHFRGDENAPVTMIEFSDFQWPFCGRFAADAGRQIDEQYVKNGKVRFAYWHFPFLGDESQWAAEASECAGDQNKFWEYHDLIFTSQAGENQGAFSKDNLKKLAIQLGLDSTAFDQCLDSGKYTEFVQTQAETARQMGITSTPAFLINGQAVLGAQSFESFQQLIDGLIAQAN